MYPMEMQHQCFNHSTWCRILSTKSMVEALTNCEYWGFVHSVVEFLDEKASILFWRLCGSLTLKLSTTNIHWNSQKTTKAPRPDLRPEKMVLDHLLRSHVCRVCKPWHATRRSSGFWSILQPNHVPSSVELNTYYVLVLIPPLPFVSILFYIITSSSWFIIYVWYIVWFNVCDGDSDHKFIVLWYLLYTFIFYTFYTHICRCVRTTQCFRAWKKKKKPRLIRCWSY